MPEVYVTDRPEFYVYCVECGRVVDDGYAEEADAECAADKHRLAHEGGGDA